MISGLLWKYLNGSRFVMQGRYKTALPVSSRFVLTVPTGTLESRKLQITLDRLALAKALKITPDAVALGLEQVITEGPFRRRGSEAKTTVGVHVARPDHVLLRTLRNAHRWSLELRAGTPLSGIASEAGHHSVHIRTRAALAFLSPKIQCAIRDGALPPDLNLQRTFDRGVPLDWSQQERLFGMALYQARIPRKFPARCTREMGFNPLLQLVE